VPNPPTSTQTSLRQRLSAHAQARWPALRRVEVRFRGRFAYLTGHLSDDEAIPLCRLRYGGSASSWGFGDLPRQATTSTKTASYPPDIPPAPPKKHSTAPAASTSTTPPPGNPKRR